MYSALSKTKVNVFNPFMEDFQDFGQCIMNIESLGAQESGLAKIIPPSGWIPRKTPYSTYEVMNITIDKPIYQITTTKERGYTGIFQQSNIPFQSKTVAQYQRMAKSERYKTPACHNLLHLERIYWENITYRYPIYGSGVPGTLIDDSVKVWNISKLGILLDYLFENDDPVILGHTNTPYLDFGMWKSTFAWHKEYMDLYRINYLHSGYPKQWYVIPPEYEERFRAFAARHFAFYDRACPAFLSHKMTLISPKILNKFEIPFNTITQYPGEFIISFPGAYHCSFDYGYNIAESINFASTRWIQYGLQAAECKCENIPVTFEVNSFLRRSHPNEIRNVYRRTIHYRGHYGNPTPVIEISSLNNSYSVYSKRDNDTVFDENKSYSHIEMDLVDLEESSYATKQLVTSGVWLDADGNILPKTQLIKNVVPNKIRHLVGHYSLEIEQQYNILRSMENPYCSLCFMFCDKKTTFDEDWKTKVTVSMMPPISNLPPLTEALFRFFLVDGHTMGLVKDSLIRCRKCYLTVHKTCYDISSDDESTSWLCDRCQESKLDVACAYCPLKVGVVKLVQKDVWAHSVCHLLLHNKFKNIEIMASKTKCCVCNLACGICFNCYNTNCNNQFHILCGLLSGFNFLIDIQNTNKILIDCVQHNYE